jgi:phosphopantothenoylcysteine decarboxylase/phosphopantothenate--cysteine ligase
VKQTLQGKNILLIIGGGIAAYKALDLIRRMKEGGASVKVIMTEGAQKFITPLSVGALSNNHVFTDLFDLNEEQEIGHIRLAREADLVLVAPATANLLAKMANGLANDLASTVLLATNKPVLVAPAMNPFMWQHSATQRNVTCLKQDAIMFCGPEEGEMAESGESGLGRMAEPLTIVAALEDFFAPALKPLSGFHMLITSGPTHEPIDPIRFISNRSSGKQGHALAKAAAQAGAKVTLVSGPVDIPDPDNVNVIHVETAEDMAKAVSNALPADIGIFAAAVGDWRIKKQSNQKLKKKQEKNPVTLSLEENTDILSYVGHHKTQRPKLVIGFAAETENIIENALEKLERKKADWIIANDVSKSTGVMGQDKNTIHIITPDHIEEWPEMSKTEVAEKLLKRLQEYFKKEDASAS